MYLSNYKQIPYVLLNIDLLLWIYTDMYLVFHPVSVNKKLAMANTSYLVKTKYVARNNNLHTTLTLFHS